MTERVDEQQRPPEDALADGLQARRGAGSPAARALRELGAVDKAVYRAVADTPTPLLDAHVRRLSNAANYSRLWLGISAAVAVLGGRRGRRAALEGVLAIGATSAAVNLGIKPIASRKRPDRASGTSSDARFVSMPKSTSFPSGHSASAFAFAYAVGRRRCLLRTDPAARGRGRLFQVHTGVHYPGDVAIGSILGAGTAAIVAATSDGLRRSRQNKK